MDQWKWVENLNGDLVCDEASAKLREVACYNTRAACFAVWPRHLTSPSTLSDSSPQITVTECGHAFPSYTQEDIATFDPINPLQQALIEQLQNIFDRCAMAALKSTNLRISAKHFCGLIFHNTFFSAVPAVTAYMKHNVKPYFQNWYVGFGGKGVMEFISKNPEYKTWSGYLEEGDLLYKGEQGMYQHTRWILIEDEKTLSSEEGVVIGEDALGQCGADPPYLLATGNKIGWCGVVAFGPLEKDRAVYIYE